MFLLRHTALDLLLKGTCALELGKSHPLTLPSCLVPVTHKKQSECLRTVKFVGLLGPARQTLPAQKL